MKSQREPQPSHSKEMRSLKNSALLILAGGVATFAATQAANFKLDIGFSGPDLGSINVPVPDVIKAEPEIAVTVETREVVTSYIPTIAVGQNDMVITAKAKFNNNSGGKGWIGKRIPDCKIQTNDTFQVKSDIRSEKSAIRVDRDILRPDGSYVSEVTLESLEPGLVDIDFDRSRARAKVKSWLIGCPDKYAELVYNGELALVDAEARRATACSIENSLTSKEARDALKASVEELFHTFNPDDKNEVIVGLPVSQPNNPDLSVETAINALISDYGKDFDNLEINVESDSDCKEIYFEIQPTGAPVKQGVGPTIPAKGGK
jgi:hypothetical protein